MDSKTYYEIWNRVEQAAFMPEPKKVKGWLTNLNSFFNKIVGKPNLSWPKSKNGKINYTLNYDSMNLVCQYEINEDLSGFSFKITLLEQTVSFDYSNRDFCEFDYLHKHYDEKAKNINKKDLVEVLKQKIVHPAIHLHLTDDDDSLHESRSFQGPDTHPRQASSIVRLVQKYGNIVGLHIRGYDIYIPVSVQIAADDRAGSVPHLVIGG